MVAVRILSGGGQPEGASASSGDYGPITYREVDFRDLVERPSEFLLRLIETRARVEQITPNEDGRGVRVTLSPFARDARGEIKTAIVASILKRYPGMDRDLPQYEAWLNLRCDVGDEVYIRGSLVQSQTVNIEGEGRSIQCWYLGSPDFSKSGWAKPVFGENRNALQALSNAIDLYAAEHGGRYPGADNQARTFIAQMTGKTDAHGRPGGEYGPYLDRLPALDLGTRAGAQGIAFAADPVVDGSKSAAWIYDSSAGYVIANAHDYPVD